MQMADPTAAAAASAPVPAAQAGQDVARALCEAGFMSWGDYVSLALAEGWQIPRPAPQLTAAA